MFVIAAGPTVLLALIALSVFSCCESQSPYEIYLQKQEKITEVRREAAMSAMELITSNGYPVESHTVTTKDGHLLEIHRIPHGKDQRNNDTRVPVLVLHGFLMSSKGWVDNKNLSLGFFLADNGFDVWLGNIRGNIYGLGHVSLSHFSEEFWDHSWDEFALLDLPAMIDYVLNATGFDQLVYIGYSQGTTIMFALLSELTEYNDKIKLYVALTPVASFDNVPNTVLPVVAVFAPTIKFFLQRILGMKYLQIITPLTFEFFVMVVESNFQFVCDYALETLGFGCNEDLIDKARLPVYINSFSSASFDTVIHWTQLSTRNKFSHLDVGERGNIARYGSVNPPEYNISNIKVPVALFWGRRDQLANIEDEKILSKMLPNVILNYRVPFNDFTHIDFAFATNAMKLVYEPVVDLLKDSAEVQSLRPANG